MTLLRRKIREWAVFSRLIIFVIQILFNTLIPDHKSDGFRTPLNEENNFLDLFLTFICGGFTHWDAQHFLHIAKYGYTYENNVAFLPLYPSLMKILANTIGYPLQSILSYHSVLIISGLFINFVCFIASAEVLYELSRCVLQEEKLAYRATLFFCFNPASIFFSAIYTESLFSLCVFTGMLYYEKKRIYLSSICFAFAGAVRSNSIINFGFPIYYILSEIIKSMDFKQLKINILTYISVFHILKLLLCFCVITIPFFAHQVYAYKIFCDVSEVAIPRVVREYSEMSDLLIASSDLKPSWCYDYLPISYNSVQEKYWNVGFLKYYKWKQIPNFLLAVPITLILVFNSARYCLKNRKISLRLGFEIGDNKFESIGVNSALVFVYIVHVVTQLIFGWLFINVQVVTRLICASSPVVYWFSASVTLDDKKLIPLNKFPAEELVNKIESKENILRELLHNYTKSSKVIMLYFFLYYVIGTLMFVNELPFT